MTEVEADFVTSVNQPCRICGGHLRFRSNLNTCATCGNTLKPAALLAGMRKTHAGPAPRPRCFCGKYTLTQRERTVYHNADRCITNTKNPLELEPHEVDVWSAEFQAIAKLGDAHFDLFNEMESTKKGRAKRIKALGTLQRAGQHIRNSLRTRPV